MSGIKQYESKTNMATRILMGLAFVVAMMVPQLALAVAPAVDNADGATSVTMTNAVLNGMLTSTGGVPTQVYVYWGETNGGTTFDSWTHTNDFGVNPVGPLNITVTNLLPVNTYYYRYYATNADGEAWAGATTNFQTLASAAQAPVDLRSCDHFVILAATTVTYPGAGSIHGDVGLDPGTGAGLLIPAVQVIGIVYTIDAAYTLPAFGSVIDVPLLNQAKLDLTAAYLDAEGRTLDRITMPGDIGGLTLAPGLYWSASSLLITGDVTLDAGGDPNAVWIFQIGSTLTTAAGAPLTPESRVVLAGGAQAKNIFWQVDTATLGTYSVFRGTIMALNAITMGVGSTTSGRALSRNDAVTYNGSGGSLPQYEEGGSPLTIVITSPTNTPTYVGTTNSQNIGGWAADSVGTGVTLVTLRNDRDVASYNAAGTALWQITNGLPVYQGTNNIRAIAYDGSMNSATDVLRVVYSGDAQYDAVLRSGNIVQFINFPDNLTAGETNNVQWSVLSYVPIVSRIYAGVPGGWSFFKNGTYQGMTNSPWNLNGRHAKVYSFDCDWIVPENSGEFKIWFNVAQMDSDQFMIPIIPDGIDTRSDPVYAKLIDRTILAGGTEVATLSGLDNWDSGWIFETLAEQKERSGVTITSITMPDNLTQGAPVTCEWRVQSYVDVNAQVLLLNVASSNVWLTADATRIGVPSDTTYNFQDRSSGTTNYAKEYTFQATFIVPAQPGVQQLYFRSQNSSDTNSLWMAQNLSAGVDSRPVLENGRFGRMINRTID